MRLIKDGVNYFTLTKEEKLDSKLMTKIRKFIQDKDVVYICNIHAKFSIGYIQAKQLLEQLVCEGVLETKSGCGYIVRPN